MKSKKSALSKIRKGSTVTAIVSVILVVSSLGIAMERFGGEFIWSTQESFNLYNKYFTLTMDKNIQSMKQGFMKTTAFFSLNTVSKELADHGGYAKETLDGPDANSNNILDVTEASGAKIYVKQDLYSFEKIPFWTIPNCENTLKRVPYLKDANVYFAAGEALIVLMRNDPEHLQYVTEINDGEYSLYASVQLFMIKPGTVEIVCEAAQGCERVGGTPLIITEDGIYKYKISTIDIAETHITLPITAKNDSGEIDNVVRVKQVVTSIHGPDIVSPNELFTEKLGIYYNNYYDENNEDTILMKRNEESEIKLKIAPLEGTITRGLYESYVEGTVWPDEDAGGISAEMDDLLFPGKKLVEMRDSGLITEETKIRYYKLYTYAERFTGNSQQLFQSRLWSALHNLDRRGHFETSGVDKCGRPICSDSEWCPDDEVDSYTRNEMYNEISDVLNQIESECDTLMSLDDMAGITWEITLDDGDYAPHSTTNINRGACSGAEHIETVNFEYIEYIEATYKYLYRDYSCCEGYQCTSCGSTSYNYQDVNRCTMHYDRRYILKNLKIYIKITDGDYKIYDTNTNTWEELEFKFYVTVPIVDMNCCGGSPKGGHDCKDHETACINSYGEITADDILKSSAGPLTIITGPTVNLFDITDQSASIKWITNKPSTAKVKYSETSGGPYTELPGSTNTIGHMITIDGIQSSQTYYYIVESTAGAETATSDEKSFTTMSDETDPEITFIRPTTEQLESWMGPIIDLEVDASDNTGIEKVEFYFYEDEVSPGILIDTLNTPPYSCTANIVTLLGNPEIFAGSYRIEAIAYDTAMIQHTKSTDIIVNVRDEINLEITDVEVIKASSEATIVWTTLIIASCTFEYCLDADCTIKDIEIIRTIIDDTDLANYIIDISDLEADEAYTYTISANAPAYEDQATETGSFTTLKPAPVISDIQVTDITGTTATISWNTDVNADCHLDYGILPGHDSTNTVHSIGIVGLAPLTVYNYEITCSNIDSESATETGPFTTLA